LQYLLIFLLALAFAMIQSLIGGARQVYALPACMAFGIAGMVAAAVPWKRQPARPNWPSIGSALILAGYIVWRSWHSPVDYLARPDFYMVIGALLVYLCAAIHLQTSRERMIVVWVLLAFAACHVAVGAVQFKGKENFMLLPWIYRPDYSYRASGFYIGPNHLAGLLEFLGMLALGMCCWGRGRPWLRIVAAYAVLMCLGGVALTGSRGGYLCTMFGLLVFGILSLWLIGRLRRDFFWGMFILALLTAAGIIAGTVQIMSKSDDLRERLGQIYDPTNMRFHMWRAALQQFQLSPMVGTGSGTYLYYGRQFRDRSVLADPQHVHNDYLELLAEYGVVGCVLMAAFLGIHLFSAFRGLHRVVEEKLKPAWRTSSNELALIVGGLSGVFALFAHSIIDFNLHIPANTLVVAFILGILGHPTNDAAMEDAVAAPHDFAWWRLLAPASGIALFSLSVPRIEAEYLGERARICLRDGMYQECRDFAERALTREGHNPELYYYLGEAKQLLALQADQPAARVELLQGAAEALRKGLELFKQDLSLLLTLGATLDNLGQFGSAEAIFQRALAADPNFGSVYAYYGVHHHFQGHLKEARQCYEKAQSLGEWDISDPGLKKLEKDRATQRENDVFREFPPDPEDKKMKETPPKKAQ
jgi:O-antigen ligase